MKVILCFCLFTIFVSSIAQSQHENVNKATQEKRAVLKRTTRNTFAGLRDQFLMILESIVIFNCKDNGRVEEANNLQNVYDEMKACVNKKKLFLTPEDEYLSNLIECSKEPITKTRDCLADNQSYFPEFILNLTKSYVNFLYDDIDLLRVDLTTCLPKLTTTDAQTAYIQCIHDTAVQTNDSVIIPPSKEEYCQRFLPSNFCFTNSIKEHCDNTPNLKKFREDYIAAAKRPCEITEIN